jgi:carbamoylphosphate synthase large subunit
MKISDRPKSIICIGGGKSQLPLIEEVKKSGWHLIVIDQDPKAVGFIHADLQIIESTYNFSFLKKYFVGLKQSHQFAGIINRSSGPPVITAAKLAEFLGLETIPIDTAKNLVNKHLLYKAFKHFDIKIPDTHIFKITENIEYSLQSPVIVKPSLSLVGKSGIQFVENQKDLLAAVEYAKENTVNDHIVIQDFVEGIDISLISFVRNSELHPICYLQEMNPISEAGVITGKAFKTLNINKFSGIIKNINNLIYKIIHHFNIINSPLNIAFRLDSQNELSVLEIHLDIGGDLLLEQLIPAALELNFAELALQYSVTSKFSYAYKSPRPSAVIFEAGDGLNSDRNFKLIQAQSFESLDNQLNEILPIAYDQQK